MYRAAIDKARTHRAWSRHHVRHVRREADYGMLSANWVCGASPESQVSCACDNQANRFRKSHWVTQGSQWANPRSWGESTRQEARSEDDFREWLAGVHDG